MSEAFPAVALPVPPLTLLFTQKTSVRKDACDSTDTKGHDVCASREKAPTSTCAGQTLQM